MTAAIQAQEESLESSLKLIENRAKRKVGEAFDWGGGSASKLGCPFCL